MRTTIQPPKELSPLIVSTSTKTGVPKPFGNGGDFINGMEDANSNSAVKETRPLFPNPSERANSIDEESDLDAPACGARQALRDSYPNLVMTENINFKIDTPLGLVNGVNQLLKIIITIEDQFFSPPLRSWSALRIFTR